VENVLWQLLEYCAKEKELIQKRNIKELQKHLQDFDKWRFIHSARKIKQMLMMLEERGYVSYFE